MRLAARTSLSMLAVASLPLALAGWSAIRLSDEALRTRASELHQALATSLEQWLTDTIATRVRSVQDAGNSHDFIGLSEAAREGALALVYRQVEGASTAVLLDPTGAQVAGPIFLARRSEDPSLKSRPPVSEEDIQTFARHIPDLVTAGELGSALGPTYRNAKGEPRMVAVSKTSSGLLLAVELSLSAESQRLTGTRIGKNGRAYVVDQAGQLVLGDASVLDRSRWPPVEALRSGQPPPAAYRDPLLGEVLGATARVQSQSWTVVAAEPVAEALAAARTLTRRTLLWLLVAMALALALGVLSTRAVVRPIRTLHAGATALRGGDLGHRLELGRAPDELGELAVAFNEMAGEIQRWNQELEDRVKEKTRELKEAQEVILRSQKMAAVGELGAGVAHEINNPLTGLLGMAQILQMREPEDSERRPRIDSILDQGRRIQEIVASLGELSYGSAVNELKPASLVTAVESALSLVRQRLEEAGITLERRIEEDLPSVPGDPGDLAQLFAQLFTNALRAMPEGGTLTVSLRATDGQFVTAVVQDTGIGIAPELHGRIFEPFFSDRKAWGESKGIGLSVVHGIVEKHHGRILVDSEVGQGATFTLILPAVQGRSLV